MFSLDTPKWNRSSSALATVLVCLALLAVPVLPAVAAQAATTAPGSSGHDAVPDSDRQGAESDLDLTVMTAPHDARLANESAIEAARDEGRLTATDDIALGDRLVLRLTADDLGTDLRDAEGSTAAERLRTLFDRDRLDLYVHQTTETTAPDLEPKVLELQDPAAMTVVPAGADAVYLAYDTDALDAVFGGSTDGRSDPAKDRVDVQDGEAFNVTVAVGDETATVVPTFVDREVDGPAIGDALYGVPGERGTAALATTLAPGTAVPVRIALDGREPRTITATVGESGDLAVPLDFANVSTATEGVATVTDAYDGRYASEESRTAPISVRTERGDLDRAEAVRRSDSVRFRTGVNVSHPAFVAVFDGEGDPVQVFGPYGPGSSDSPDVFREVDLQPGDEVEFVAVRDVNQNGEYDAADERFAGGDAVVTGTVEDGQTETTDRSTTPPTTGPEPTTTRNDGPGTATTSDTSTVGGTTAETDDGPVPTVGIVGTVAALLAALALVRRRAD